MTPRFYYSETALDQLLNLAPAGTVAIALLSKEDHSYRCSVEICSRFGPLAANAVQPTVAHALSHIQNIMTEKLTRQRSESLNYDPVPA